MKKATILVQDKDAKQTADELRRLGLLHIEHHTAPQGKEISSLKDDLALCREAETILSLPEFNNHAIGRKKIETDWKITAKHIIDIYKRIDHLKTYSLRLYAQLEEWQAWGDFDPQAIKDLAAQGIFIKLYQIPAGELKKIPKNITVVHIKTIKGAACVATVSLDNAEIRFTELALPNTGISKLKNRLFEDSQVLTSLVEELKSLILYKESLLETKESLLKSLEFEEAVKGMGQSENIMFLTGYLPYDKTNILFKAASDNSWAIFVRDPDQTDCVPTLISNPRWISIINPVFKFIEVIPGYRELDISLPFLIFFSIFFGILIGDAGYGLVYALITFLLQAKLRKKHKTASFTIFYILSFSAVIWGILTGTFFGQEWVLKAGYKPLIPALVDEKGLQRFCFLLGAIHLSLAHAWRGIIKMPSLSALGDLGWMCVLWSAFFIARSLILGDAFPSFGIWLLLSGILLVAAFTNPGKNIFKSAEEWVAWIIGLPLSFMGNFADVVSYIRLFAVGMAGVAIADAFNSMAASLGSSNVFLIIAAALIAIIGNAVSIVLGPVSVLVHGVRLNVLEFSGHASVSWSGINYKPLKK
ncbi:MAG: hypothetical protein PHP17_07540 [Candidatus Omnitrophica bacterium]|nr:hypothetical protein [Candidatus Omnitrophota bacterium]